MCCKLALVKAKCKLTHERKRSMFEGEAVSLSLYHSSLIQSCLVQLKTAFLNCCGRLVLFLTLDNNGVDENKINKKLSRVHDDDSCTSHAGAGAPRLMTHTHGQSLLCITGWCIPNNFLRSAFFVRIESSIIQLKFNT